MKQLWILGPPHSWNPGLEIQRWNAGLGWDFQGQLDGRAVASGFSASKLREDFVVCMGNLRCVGPHIMQPCAEAFWILDWILDFRVLSQFVPVRRGRPPLPPLLLQGLGSWILDLGFWIFEILAFFGFFQLKIRDPRSRIQDLG